MNKTLLLLFACCLLAVGCVATHSDNNPADQISQQPVLRVGISADARPMAFHEHDRIAGLEADFAKGLAKYTHRRLVFVELPWPKQIPALLAGKTDIIMSAMTITRARDYQISFSNPYMITGQISLVRLRDVSRFGDGLTDLLSPVVRIGTVDATTGDLLIIRNKARGAVLHFKDADHGVQALLDKTIDAFVYDLPMNFYLGAKYADKGLVPVTVPLSREYLAWGMRKDDHHLINAANGYLKNLHDSGQLQQMIIHWIPFYQSVYNRQ